MRKRPDIPEDVFFEDTPAVEAEDADKTLKRESAKMPAGRASRADIASEEQMKSPVTIYLTRPILHRLEEARFLLLTEHGVKTSKSAIANYALGTALEDLDAAAEALRKE